MTNVIIDLNMTRIEKEAMHEFLKLRQEKAPLLILGAEELSLSLTKYIHEISRPRAYAILSKLEEKGLLLKIKRKGFIPTEEGFSVLDEFEHRLKILELFFYQIIGLPLESNNHMTSASKEASRLVLHVSFELIEILCERLANPKTCPHGLVIPHHNKHPELYELLKRKNG